MTVKEIIETAERLKPSQYQREDLLRWLNQLEGRIWLQVIRTHHDSQPTWEPYTQETWERVPLAAGPFEDLYLNWLYAQIDYHNAEEIRYNNHMVMHEELMDMFKAWYNREHMPVEGPEITGYRGW